MHIPDHRPVNSTNGKHVPVFDGSSSRSRLIDEYAHPQSRRCQGPQVPSAIALLSPSLFHTTSSPHLHTSSCPTTTTTTRDPAAFPRDPEASSSPGSAADLLKVDPAGSVAGSVADSAALHLPRAVRPSMARQTSSAANRSPRTAKAIPPRPSMDSQARARSTSSREVARRHRMVGSQVASLREFWTPSDVAPRTYEARPHFPQVRPGLPRPAGRCIAVPSARR